MGPMSNKKAFTLAEIREAFWAEFHKAGEVFFSYLGEPDENTADTEDSWRAFVSHLPDDSRNAVHGMPQGRDGGAGGQPGQG